MIKRGRYFVTHKCNLTCPFCLSSSGAPMPNELEAEELRPIFENFKNAGMTNIGISGGEPFLVFDRTLTAVKIFTEFGIKVRVFTNGTLTTDERVQLLLDAGLEAFHVSIDGMEIGHDKVRGEGTWKLAIETIKTMKRLGAKVRTVTLLRKDTYDEAVEIVNLMESIGVDEIFLKEINMSVGRAKEMDNHKLDMRSLPEELINNKRITIKEYGNFKATCDTMSVNPDGSLISCGQVQEALGNGFCLELSTVFEANRTCKFRDISNNKNGSGAICCDY